MPGLGVLESEFSPSKDQALKNGLSSPVGEPRSWADLIVSLSNTVATSRIWLFTIKINKIKNVVCQSH